MVKLRAAGENANDHERDYGERRAVRARTFPRRKECGDSLGDGIATEACDNGPKARRRGAHEILNVENGFRHGNAVTVEGGCDFIATLLRSYL